MRNARSDIRRLALGRLISITGSAAAYTALMYTIWNRTHNATLQSLALLLTFGVSGIAGTLTGALGDRFDRRMVMAVSEASAATVFAVMAFAGSPVSLIALAFCSAIFESPFWSASRAAIPNLAEDQNQIAWANSWVTIGVNTGIALGPVLAGVLLYLVGPSWVFGLNAASFLVSAALTLSVRRPFSGTVTEDEHDEHRGVLAGFRYLVREPMLRVMTLAWLVFVIGMGMGMVADAALAEHFSAGKIGFGLIITCWGSGSVLGSFLGRWLNARTEPLALVVGSVGVAVAGLAISVAPVFLLVLLALLVMGTSDGLTMVADNGIRQRRSPDAVRSRVMAASEAAISLGMAIAFVIAGPVLNSVGPKAVYAIGGAGAALAAIVLLPTLKLRRTETSAEPLELEQAFSA
jgi:MFS family permease